MTRRRLAGNSVLIALCRSIAPEDTEEPLKRRLQEEPIEGGELYEHGEGLVGSGIVHGGSTDLPSDGISAEGYGLEHDLDAHATHGVYGHGFATGSHGLVHEQPVIHDAHVFHAPSYVVHHPVGAHYVHHYTTVSHKTVAVPVPAPVKKVKTLVRNHYGTVYRRELESLSMTFLIM